MRINGAIVDTRPALLPAPTKEQLLKLPPRADLKLRITYQVTTQGAEASAFAHSRTIDANPGRYAFFGNAVNVYVLGPGDMVEYNPDGPTSYRITAPAAIVAYIDVGITPAEGPSGAIKVAQYTHRLTIPAGPLTPASQIPIPNGATRLQVFDASNWSWFEPTQPAIPVTGGQSQIVLVPNACKVGPGVAGINRTALAVFEVQL